LSIIASDAFEGRETGTEGNDKAADYIAEQFKKMGIAPGGEDNTYFQLIGFSWERWQEIGLSVHGERYRHLWDYISYPTQNSDLPQLASDKILFLGYGIDDPKYSDYKGVEVKDKILMIYDGEPVDEKGVSYLTGDETLSEWSNKDATKKLILAKAKGAKAVLIIDGFLKDRIQQDRRKLIGRSYQLGVPDKEGKALVNSVYISPTLAKAIMGEQKRKVIKARKVIQKRRKARHRNLKTDFQLQQVLDSRSIVGRNVLGFLEGSDPKLKEEILAVTAHYDHLGKKGDGIYNGADDNGSGTSTVLEVADAFVQAAKKRQGAKRSILFMLMTGEEKGLLGSKYYTERPLYPLENTIANMNIDMVGRVDEKHQANPNYIYVIGSNRLSTELHDINEAANTQFTQLELDYTYNAKDDPNRFYYRSDHYNFAERGIPAVFYFNGTHTDYHRTTDTIEKIHFDKMAKIGQLIFHTAWELTNRAERIKVDVLQE